VSLKLGNPGIDLFYFSSYSTEHPKVGLLGDGLALLTELLNGGHAFRSLISFFHYITCHYMREKCTENKNETIFNTVVTED
jgi:hypothetical protein